MDTYKVAVMTGEETLEYRDFALKTPVGRQVLV